MHFRDPPGVTATLDDIVREFIPEGQCSEPRARKLGQRAEIQTIHSYTNAVKHKDTGQ